MANVAFADGHVETISGTQFPCSYALSTSYAKNGGKMTLAQEEAQNINGATVYDDPQAALQILLGNNPGAN